MDTMLKLRAARKASKYAARASLRRDDAIMRAHSEGASIREIANAVGLSPARVHQILHGK